MCSTATIKSNNSNLFEFEMSDDKAELEPI
jgi:hypothetical protein